MSEFGDIAECLRTGGKGSFQSRPFARLSAAVRDEAASPEDLAALIRHALKHQQARAGGHPQLLWPRHLPDGVDWRSFGLDAVTTDNGLVLSPESWHPDWLPAPEGVSLEDPLWEPQRRRYVEPCAGDPFLVQFGYRDYKSHGQRAAVRAALCAPPGSTLVTLLPTGFGKSLVPLSSALLEQAFQEQSVTVVVVPTTALATDQERMSERLTGQPSAYTSGAPSQELIRTRIREGEQRIVYTSPESILQGLKPSLFHAAKSGWLKTIVIDEAHIVTEWGEGFRSDFQELAGMVRALRRIQREHGHPELRLFLLTATLTQFGLETLQRLFPSNEFVLLPALSLRGEPSLWRSRCGNDEEKARRLLEAVRHLPRPLIIYTLTRLDAARIYCDLRKAGFARIGHLTGETNEADRRRLIAGWSGDELDIMVGTSAFGLGIDKQDVRAVIHACVPESLDRLYQEIGRGGRDGLACASLMLYTKRDEEASAGLAKRTIIGVLRGHERWTSMFGKATHLDGDRYRVSLEAQPSVREKDLDMRSLRNEDWNSNTLTLMARSGLIDLDDEPDAEGGPSAKTRVISIKNPRHNQPDHWESVVQPARLESAHSAAHQQLLLGKLKSGATCASETFAEAYRLEFMGRMVEVEAACGGCVAHGWKPFKGEEPETEPWPWAPVTQVDSMLPGWPASNVGFVFIQKDSHSKDATRRLRSWLENAFERGLQMLVCPEDVKARLLAGDDPVAERLRSRGLFWAPVLSRGNPEVPRIVLQLTPRGLDPKLELASKDRRVQASSPTLVLLPENAIDSDGVPIIGSISCPWKRI